MKLFVVSTLLAAGTALAQAPAEQPKETPDAAAVEAAKPAPADAPKAEAAPAPVPAESKISLADRKLPSIWLQAGAGAAAALISVPIALYIAGPIGNLSNNVYVGLMSAFLIATFLPSLAVTAAVVGIGNYYSPGTFPFWRVWGLTSVASALAWVVASLTQLVSVGAFGTILLFAICEAILLPAVAVPSARWLAAPAPGSNRLSSLEPWNPGATARWFIPAAEVSF